ncbi:gliding motility-associated C-terminal domain-containing protein [Mucilaginibacter terrae]|nr:gliding motility-associated C-terminal domain-containing protein [Mucilaginibacter terrae]
MNAFAQQDVEFHLNAHLLQGKNIIKVKRDFNDPYLWVLAQNNEVFRINSIDNTVTNYTAFFNIYNNFNLIDIAGVNKDTVFVATNSPNVIAYNNGTIRFIGVNNGLTGNVHSLGVDYSGSYLDNLTRRIPSNHSISIATATGMHHYDYRQQVMLPGSSNVPTTVYEATYRAEMVRATEAGNFPGLPFNYPAFALSLGTYGGYLYYGGAYGTINTAYYTEYPARPGIGFMNFYWGTENGLFQNGTAYSNNPNSPQKHYLDGINVNKITSLYGLKSFGTPQNEGLIKEILLVATDKGLYFSNSGYGKFSTGPLNVYDFYFYADIGNIKINHVTSNNVVNTSPVCEDGVWVASVNGLYLLKPDFGKYINPQQYQAIQFQNQPFTVTQRDICSGTTTTATVNSISYSGNSIQWYKDGVQLPAQSGTDLIIDKSGDYYAVLYDPCSTFHVESNHLKVNVISSPTADLLYPDLIQACSGSTINLAIATNPNFQYRWYKDGALTGNITGSLNTTQSGKFKYEVSACSGNWISSKEVEVKFINLASPVINSDKTAYCIGEIATLSVNVSQSPDYDINWLYNGAPLAGKLNSTSISTTDAGTYNVYLSSKILNCTGPPSGKAISFDAIPTLSIQQSSNTTFCNGETVNLKATYSNGNIKWSTGETSDNISVTTSGSYSATVKTAAGCEFNQSINVNFLPNPVISIPDARLCEYSREQITLTAPAGFAKYIWNGIAGSRNFVTNKSGVVTLVVTDANGCKASESITINNYCKDILLPNTFTPNGDGVNDTWQIIGLSSDLSTLVKVFNRNGEMVFESRGYPTAWNGQHKGKKLPAGAYYYIISTRSSKQVLSGSVTIIY